MEKQTIANILEMFQNGEQRYDKDGYFREAVKAIHAGVGPYAILDRVLKEHNILMNLHSEQVEKNRVQVAKIQIMEDELASYKDALQHYQK